jgi:hypothetical protein
LELFWWWRVRPVSGCCHHADDTLLVGPTLDMEKLGKYEAVKPSISAYRLFCDRFERRFRIYEMSEFGETIRTYKRTEHDAIIDEMVLAGKSAPPLS